MFNTRLNDNPTIISAIGPGHVAAQPGAASKKPLRPPPLLRPKLRF